MELKYMTTPKEYSRFIKKTCQRKDLKMSLIVSTVVFVFFCLFAFLHNYRNGIYIAFFLMFLVYFALLFFGIRLKRNFMVRKNIKKLGMNYFLAPKTIVVNDEGIEINTSIRDLNIPYSGVQKVTEDNEFIIIKFKAGDMIYIPIVEIKNPEIKEDFISCLKSKLA